MISNDDAESIAAVFEHGEQIIIHYGPIELGDDGALLERHSRQCSIMPGAPRCACGKTRVQWITLRGGIFDRK